MKRVRITLLALLAVIILVAACGQETGCLEGERMVGDACCVDLDENDLCDADEAAAGPLESATTENATAPINETPAVEEATTPSTATPESSTPVVAPPQPKIYTREEKAALAQKFSERVESIWEGEKWTQVHSLLIQEERATLNQGDVAFILRMHSHRTRLEHDPSYAPILIAPSYTALQGTRLTGINITLGEEEATFFVDATYVNLPVKQSPFPFVWEGNGWKLSLSLPASVGEACAATPYEDWCNYEYAKAHKAKDACIRSGSYVTKCYQLFGETPPKAAILEACAMPFLKTSRDACLSEAVIATKEKSLCDNYYISINKYYCLGLVAGQTGDLDSCIDQVSDGPSAEYEGYQCINGYVTITKESEPCKRIPSRKGDIYYECFAYAAG